MADDLSRQAIHPLGLRAGLQRQLDLFFCEMGQGMNPYLTAHRRQLFLAQLDALSDEQLQRLGLTRDEIPTLVFGELSMAG
ncbi:MAG: hypothetical protein AAF698_04505 [Pseudomonadota bacterium]